MSQRAIDNEAFARHAQRRLGVTEDGWAGDVTRKAFDLALPPKPGEKPVVAATGKLGKYSYLLGTTPDTLPPIMVRTALDMYGVKEVAGSANNPQIIAWADEVAQATKSAYADWAADFYNADSIPWCGLFQAVVAVRSAQGRPERMPEHKYLAALEWVNWGVPVGKDDAVLGDTLIFKRSGGGHVATYVGEDTTHFHILGGNQSDAVNIMRLPKKDLVAVRRPPYKAHPASAKKIYLDATGQTGGSLA